MIDASVSGLLTAGKLPGRSFGSWRASAVASPVAEVECLDQQLEREMTAGYDNMMRFGR